MSDLPDPSKENLSDPTPMDREGARRGRRLVRYVTEPQSITSSVPAMITMKMLVVALGLVSSVVVARALGPTNKGIYNLVLAVSALFATIFNLGVMNGNFFYVARREMRLATAYTSTLVVVVISSALVAPLIVVFGSGMLHRWFGSIPEQWLLVSLLILGPLTIHSIMTQSALLSINRAVATYALPLLGLAITATGATLVLLVMDLGLAGMIWVSVVGLLLTQVAAVLILRRGGPLIERPRPAELFKAVRWGFPLWAATLLSVLLQRFDQLLVVHRSGPSDLGQYALAVAIGEVLWSIDVPITTAVRFRIASGSGDDSADLIARLARLVIITMSVLCLGLAVFAHWLIPFLYSEAFGPAVPALIAYLPAVLFLSVARIVGEDLGYQRARTDLVLLNNGVALVVNVVLLLVLLPPFGIVGASLASVGAYFVLFLMTVIFHTRLAGSRMRDILVPRAADFRVLFGLCRGYISSFAARRHGVR